MDFKNRKRRINSEPSKSKAQPEKTKDFNCQGFLIVDL